MLWVRETANAVSLKKRPVLLVACDDITEQKHAERPPAGVKGSFARSSTPFRPLGARRPMEPSISSISMCWIW